MPFKVLIGMRARIDSRTSNSAGSLMTGSWRGRKPRVVETMKAGRVVSSGLVSRRTLKLREGAIDPILKRADGQLTCWEKLGVDQESRGNAKRTKNFEKWCQFLCFYLVVCVAGMKSGLSSL